MLIDLGMYGNQAQKVDFLAPALNEHDGVNAVFLEKTRGQVQLVKVSGDYPDTKPPSFAVPQCFVQDSRAIQCRMQRDVDESGALWSYSSSRWDDDDRKFEEYSREKTQTLAEGTPLHVKMWNRKSFAKATLRNFIRPEELAQYNLPSDSLQFAANFDLNGDGNFYTNTGDTQFFVVRLAGSEEDAIVTLGTIAEWIELFATSTLSPGSSSVPPTDNEFCDAMKSMMEPDTMQTPCNSPVQGLAPSVRSTTPRTPPTTRKRRDNPNSPTFALILKHERENACKKACLTYELFKNVTACVNKAQGD